MTAPAGTGPGGPAHPHLSVEGTIAPVHELRRGALGVGFVVFFVVSAAAPLTALAGGVPIGMLLGNGPGIPGLFILVMIVLAVFAAGYTAMARHISNAGSFYAFAARGLGKPAGGAAAMIALLGYNCMQIGLYGLFGVATSSLMAEFGVELPWWLFVFVAIGLVAWLGYRQIDLSAKVLATLVIVEYLVMIVLDVAILARGGDSGLNAVPFRPDAVLSGTPSVGLLFCFACFLGFEASTIYAEEARNPHRTIPIATYVSIAVIGVFYAFSSWCMVMGAGSDKLVDKIGGLDDPTMFLFTLSEQYTGAGVTRLMQVLFMSSVFAALVAFHNAVSRYFYVMGREGVLHGRLGRTHGTYQSPYMGSVLQSTMAVVVVSVFALAGADPVLTLFSWLTNLATLCVIALMALTSFAVVVYFRNRADLTDPADPAARADHPIRVFVLPLAAGIVLTSVLVLAVVNFKVLTGASEGLAWAITATLPIAAVLGVVLAKRVGRIDPARYELLGSSRL
ncbi:MAG TPA: APC family permease [Dermatophilaceae bacterium]|nr:APC family permease [Dermatophilaceae bacterium]